MLYPQINEFRDIIDLSGLWDFKTDPEKNGESEKWFEGFDPLTQIAVPASWNEQLEELGLLNYIGSVWYQKSFFIPKNFKNFITRLRVDAIAFNFKCWINGIFVGEDNDGFLPSEFEINNYLDFGSTNQIIILANNELQSSSIPQGIESEDYQKENRLRDETFPPARFDFFPFGGIHRPIKITTTPRSHISDIKISTKILKNNVGQLTVKVITKEANGLIAHTILKNNVNLMSTEQFIKNGTFIVKFEISNCHFWSPKSPYLYSLLIKILDKENEIDFYQMPVGIREVEVKDNKLFLNGECIYLKGFGKHEDFSVIGKGFSLPVVIKEFQMLKWINANSFRTSHYPYAEETMQLADRLGFLIIDEVPANSLDFRHVCNGTLTNHKKSIQKLIARDSNYASVIMWSLGNEPNLVGESSYYDGRGSNYWKEIFEFARSLDSSRPMTVPNCFRAGLDDPVLELSDIISINRYYGWYEYPGRIDLACELLTKELDEIHKRFNKPVLLSEFGADTIPGLHSVSDQLFTEEYQTKLIEKHINVLRTRNFVIGEHVWNFADFRTPLHHRRVFYNMKGVFTRDRLPKSVAFKLREIWKEE